MGRLQGNHGQRYGINFQPGLAARPVNRCRNLSALDLNSEVGSGVLSASIGIAVILIILLILSQLALVAVTYLRLNGIANEALRNATQSASGSISSPSIVIGDQTIANLLRGSGAYIAPTWQETSNTLTLRLATIFPQNHFGILGTMGLNHLTVSSSAAIESVQ